MAVMMLLAIACHCDAGAISDTEVLAIVNRHCLMCHAANPTHEGFREAPKNVILETVGDLRKYGVTIYAQTVQTKAMPLGNQTEMSEHERAILGQWLKQLP